MDINLLRSLATLLLFIAFVMMCFMVFSKKRKSYYEAASMLPFEETDTADDKNPDGENPQQEVEQ